MTVVQSGDRSREQAPLVIDAARAHDLARMLATAVAGDVRRVVVDLRDLETVDSTTLTALKRGAALLRSRGGRLAVVCEHPAVVSLLNLTLLSRSFDVFDSVDAALDGA